MNERHQDTLTRYLNDLTGHERDIIEAARSQLDEDRVMKFPELSLVLNQMMQAGAARLALLKKLSKEEEDDFGAALKEGTTAVMGTLAGIYGKVREHPVSRMVRDDIIALDAASVGYGMLLTLALSVGHEDCATMAGRGLDEIPAQIIALTDLLPITVAEELAADAPLVNPAAVQVANARIRDAWRNIN